MRTYEIKKTKNFKHLIGTKPLKEHYVDLIKEPTKFIFQGKVVAIYDKVDEKTAKKAKKISLTTKPNKSKRQFTGVPTISSVFGSIPKNGVRTPSCRGTLRNKEEKSNFLLITDVAETLSENYKRLLPNQYEKDRKNVFSSIETDYLFKGMPFTTYNANKNQIIKYHVDKGNLKGVMSNVLISRQGVSGGELIFPEYGFALAQEDGFYSIFDGQKEIHGVADCKFVSPDSYRCSFVFYTLEQMKHCKPYLVEMEQEKKHFTEKNKNRSKTFGMSKSDFLRGKYKDI